MMRTLLWLFIFVAPSYGVLDEKERLAEYHKRNYTWPLDEVVPNTPGWRQRMFRRLSQVSSIANSRDRYNGWMAALSSAIVAPNFTENGWGLTRAPTDLVEELKQSLHKGLPTAKTEKFINVIEGNEDERPLLVPQAALNSKVLRELKSMHEEWSGLSLQGATAYGLRAYRNNSVLNMHVDRMSTHVISCILHVDHSADSEPWPIFIEDFQGNTNEVVLESGDMMFYESSKCIHGRPRKFNGSWYSSIFVHYFPTGWRVIDRDLEVHYAVPPHWLTIGRKEPGIENLEMVGTSMKEPDCPDNWCASQNSIKWFGPAKAGEVISTGYTDSSKVERDREAEEDEL